MIFTVKTGCKSELIEITSQIEEAIASAGVSDGLCYIFVPHTTCAVTINENCDPHVKRDLLDTLDRLVPDDPSYLHAEGNSAAHVKTTLTGSSELVAVENGHLVLGTWQGIFLCEYDGPRTRKVLVKLT